MKKLLLALMLLGASFNAYAVDPKLEPTTTHTCTAPTEREDGTPITTEEIKEFRFYTGSLSGDYQQTTPSPVCSWSYDNTLDPSDHNVYIVVTVVDQDGRESRYSTEKVHGVYWVKLPNPPVWD